MLFLRGARPPRLARLCFYLLLWMLESPLATEPCRSWTDDVENLGGVFWCQKFCCGTCSAPYCCSSIKSRLDPRQCHLDRWLKQITLRAGANPAPDSRLPKWAIVLIMTVATIVFGSIICGLRRPVGYICRRVQRWRESQNQDQQNIQLPNLCVPPRSGPSTTGENPPHPSAEDPHGSTASSPASNVPPAAPSGHANVGYRANETPTHPSRSSEPAPRSAAERSHGARPRTYGLVQHGRPRNSAEYRGTRHRRSVSVGACVLDHNDSLLYSVENIYDSQAWTAALTLDALPRCSTRASLSGDAGDPSATEVLLSTPDVSSLAQLDHANASFQNNEAQHRCSDSPLAMGGLSPSQADLSSLVPSCSDAEEPPSTRHRVSASSGPGLPRYHPYGSLGARPRTSASVGRGRVRYDRAVESHRARRQTLSVGCLPPSYEVCVLDCDELPPYTAEDPYDSQALGTLHRSSQALSSSQGSAMASPSLAPEDLPPDSAISDNLQCLPCALDCPPVEQIPCATPGSVEDEAIILTPPDLLGASAAGPISDP